MQMHTMSLAKPVSVELVGAVIVTCSDGCHSGGPIQMLGPAPVISAPNNPPFRYAANLLSTALLTSFCFALCF